jgi:hypothetical protein
MEHAEAIEAIELAAVEPDGLVRLMAGDTPASAAVAGHLAGCPVCVAELGRIGRTSAIAREVIAAAPDPALKARTLAFVREVGVDRSAASEAGSRPVVGSPVVAHAPAAGPGLAIPAPVAAPHPPDPLVQIESRRPRPPAWFRYAAIAAAAAIAVGLGAAGATLTRAPDTSSYEVAVLQGVAEATLRLQARPDVVRVELAATSPGAGSAGTVLYSPSSREIVMVASGLAQPADGFEYGCWMEVDGQKRRIGRMYAGGDLEAWAGPVNGLADVVAGAQFGVSLAPKAGGAGTPLLTGTAPQG